jgi:hypothetical protein
MSTFSARDLFYGGEDISGPCNGGEAANRSPYSNEREAGACQPAGHPLRTRRLRAINRPSEGRFELRRVDFRFTSVGPTDSAVPTGPPCRWVVCVHRQLTVRLLECAKRSKANSQMTTRPPIEFGSLWGPTSLEAASCRFSI